MDELDLNGLENLINQETINKARALMAAARDSYKYNQ